MTDIDTSSYNTAPNNSANQLAGFISAKNGMQANQLQEMQLQGNQGLANLYANAPKDADGNPDTNYVIQNAGQAGIHAPEAIQGALTIQNQKAAVQRQLLGLSEDRLSLGKNINDAIVASTVPMVKDLDDDIRGGTYDPDAWRKKVMDAGVDVVNASRGPDGKPVVTPQSVATRMSGLNFDDPLGLQKGLVNRVSQAQAWDSHLGDALLTKRGQMGTSEIGGQTQPTNTNVFTGTTTPAGKAIPTGTAFNQASGHNQFNSTMAPTDNSFSYSSPQNPNNSRQQLPSMGGNPTPSDSIQPGTRITPDQAPLPEPPPGYEHSLGAALDRANGAIDHANSVIQLRTPLEGILKLADTAGPGPNAALANKIKGSLIDTPFSGLFDDSKSDVAKYEILNKYASDVVGQNMGANASTDLGRSVQQLSNPSSAQFPQALKTVAKYLLARTDAAKAYGNYMSSVVGGKDVTPSKVVNAETDWRNNFDQDIFELPYMNDDEKKNLIGGMPDKNRKAFISKAQYLAKQGLINPDDM